MKKLITLALLAALLAGCSQAPAPATVSTDDRIQALEAELAATKEENKKLKETKPEETKPEETKPVEPVPDDEPITRQNPARFDEPIHIAGDYLGVPLKATITLSELQRGEDAMARLREANMYNELKEGEDVLIYKVTYTLEEYKPDADKAYYLSEFHFDYYRPDFSEYRSNNYMVLDDNLATNLYEGGTATGYVYHLIPEGESGYILFDRGLWFKVPEN